MKLMLIFAVFIVSSFQAQAWVIQSGNSIKWLFEQEPKMSVYTEMNKYFVENDPETDAKPYINSFIESIHLSLTTEAEWALEAKTAKASCVPSREIVFPKILTTQYNFSSKREFEKEIVKIQSYDCLGHLDLNKVFNTLMSESFQKVSVEGLKEIKTDQMTNQVCQKVSVFPLGTSNFCFTQNVLSLKNQYIIHSFNEMNIGQPSAPAYFREAVTVITRLPDGEISLYNLAYARGPDLPFHSAVIGMIENKQEKFIQNLIQYSK